MEIKRVVIYHGDNRSRVHVLYQSLEKRFSGQVSIMFLQKPFARLQIGTNNWHNLQIERLNDGLLLTISHWLCRTTYPHILHGNQFESFFFKSGDDLANKSSLDPIGLDHDESPLLIVIGHRDWWTTGLLFSKGTTNPAHQKEDQQVHRGKLNCQFYLDTTPRIIYRVSERARQTAGERLPLKLELHKVYSYRPPRRIPHSLYLYLVIHVVPSSGDVWQQISYSLHYGPQNFISSKPIREFFF